MDGTDVLNSKKIVAQMMSHFSHYPKSECDYMYSRYVVTYANILGMW